MGEISLLNLTVGFAECLVLLLSLLNAKEEIKLLFKLFPSNPGKFLLKSLEERALINPLKIGVSASGCSLIRILLALGSFLAALEIRGMVSFLPISCI